MELLRERVRILIPLLAAVYLGFYFFGVVMSVFNPIDSWGFSAIAAVSILMLIAFAVARRHGIDPIPPTSPLARAAHAERERRGF